MKMGKVCSHMRILNQVCIEPHHQKTCHWGFMTSSDTNQAVQPQKMVRGLKFQVKEVEGLCYLCSKNKGADQRHEKTCFLHIHVHVWENKGTDQLHDNRAADQHLFSSPELKAHG